MMLDITENNENFNVDEKLKDQFELKPLSEFEKLMELEREAVAEAVSELLAEVINIILICLVNGPFSWS